MHDDMVDFDVQAVVEHSPGSGIGVDLMVMKKQSWSSPGKPN